MCSLFSVFTPSWKKVRQTKSFQKVTSLSKTSDARKHKKLVKMWPPACVMHVPPRPQNPSPSGSDTIKACCTVCTLMIYDESINKRFTPHVWIKFLPRYICLTSPSGELRSEDWCGYWAQKRGNITTSALALALSKSIGNGLQLIIMPNGLVRMEITTSRLNNPSYPETLGCADNEHY